MFELSDKLKNFREQKIDAVESQLFEKAAQIRDQEKILLEENLQQMVQLYQKNSIIDEEEIAEVVLSMDRHTCFHWNRSY